MREDRIKISNKMDWATILIYATMVLWGWLNIYSVTYNGSQSIFSMDINSGRQLFWIGVSIIIILAIFIIDVNFYETFAYFIYGALIILLIGILVFGHEVGGNKSWFRIGSLGFQPSEFAKAATALAIAKYINTVGFKMDYFKSKLVLFLLMGIPMALTILQKDYGTALVFSIFILVFYREGMSPFLMLIGSGIAILFLLTLLVENHLILYGSIGTLWMMLLFFNRKKVKRFFIITAGAVILAGTIWSVDIVFNDVLAEHHQKRIRVFLDPDLDQAGVGYHVYQSKVAIGSGGFSGKDFLKGTQTKLEFVPEQSTDFIFCTIGEEQGWLGSFLMCSLFLILLLRLIFIAERQKSRFARVYGYSVACIFFFHFTVNIGMTIGLFPVIGLPLPFFSYGGSSLIAYTTLLFILLKLDAHRMQVLHR